MQVLKLQKNVSSVILVCHPTFGVKGQREMALMFYSTITLLVMSDRETMRAPLPPPPPNKMAEAESTIMR